MFSEVSKLPINVDIHTDEAIRHIYATDASAYRELPVGVVFPKDAADIKNLIIWASDKGVSLIPRGAGTSLAGQVVGNGLVVDISRYMNQILEINPEEKWVRVQPGIVLDELNLELKGQGLFFAPETSTSNRCVIGGMIGNNSSGLHSLIYGTTREHLLSVNAILSDGSEVTFNEINKEEFIEKCMLNNLEGNIYKHIADLLGDEQKRLKILDEFPDQEIVRRNTGYALDELMKCNVFDTTNTTNFNFCRLIAGSEGTLAFITEAKLKLMTLIPETKALVCVHFTSVKEAIRGNLIALKYNPAAVELMDDKILEMTRENIEQRKNRFFVEGNPGAILIIEFLAESMSDILSRKELMEKDLRDNGLGYHFPIVTGPDIKKVWNLRKAGLGVLSNLPGDAKPVSVVEDTSVSPAKLESYIDDFNDILRKYNLNCVYHAHISVGELHLRPILNLKDPEDVDLFRSLARETAHLVKRYSGSLSGEHGDGRLRGEFIPIMVGDEIYNWFRRLKKVWDPHNILNAGKIVDTPEMNTSLRYVPGAETKKIDTIFDYTSAGGFLGAVEKCNGSGDCRKSQLMGGTMCPSYMATKDEYTTTRARANTLREFISNSPKGNPFDHKEIYDVLDLCLSCKGCKSECPSNVDMAKYKAEFLQKYYDSHFIPIRTRMIAYITTINKIGSYLPSVFNFFASNKYISGVVKFTLGFAKQRSIPLLHKFTLDSWSVKNLTKLNNSLPENAPVIILFADEFTNYNDSDIGMKAILLLNSLGYRIEITKGIESGRTFISKGLLRTARTKAIRNIINLRARVNENKVLVGIEPSAILAFRDEYPDFVKGQLKVDAKMIAGYSYTIEEFLSREIENGKISADKFTNEKKRIKLHGHCQQKAVASTSPDLKILSFPENYSVEEIASGCCGMAGSFGFEKEHYDLSIKVGELVLLPEIRNTDIDIIIAAPGTSCRHQIKDATGRKALHPLEILYNALKDKKEF